MATPAALTPAATVAGAPGFTLLVALGGTATPAQTVRLDGNSLATTYLSPTALTATVLATDLLLPGARTITVADGAGVDGGGGLTLTVAATEAASEAPPSWLPPVPVVTDMRVTEAGDSRITQAGDSRITR